MLKAEIFVGFVNQWKEGELAQARYHALLEVGGKVYHFYTLELELLFSRAHDLGEYLHQEGIKNPNYSTRETTVSGVAYQQQLRGT